MTTRAKDLNLADKAQHDVTSTEGTLLSRRSALGLLGGAVGSALLVPHSPALDLR